MQQYGRHQDEKLHGPGIFLAVDQPACSLFCADGLVQVQGFGLRLFGLDEFRALGLRLGSYKLYGIRLHGVGSRIPGLHTFPYARSPTKSLSPFYIYVYTHTKGYMYVYIYILYSEFILICGLHIYSFHEGIRRKVFFLTLAVPRGLCYRWLSRFSCKHCKLQHLLLLCIKLLGNSNLQGPVLPQAIGG